jgi:hypothetical protein
MNSNQSVQSSFVHNESKKFKIEFHPSDHNFLVVKNCSESEGSKLCAKYGASGIPAGKESKDYSIGNFGRYK